MSQLRLNDAKSTSRHDVTIIWLKEAGGAVYMCVLIMKDICYCNTQTHTPTPITQIPALNTPPHTRPPPHTHTSHPLKHAGSFKCLSLFDGIKHLATPPKFDTIPYHLVQLCKH